MVEVAPRPEGLREAAEAFYVAQSPEDMRAALERARRLSPEAAVTHELEALWAHLHASDLGAQARHLVAALRQPDNPVAAHHLAWLEGLALTDEEEGTVASLEATLARSHPDPTVRARARAEVAFAEWREAEVDELDELEADLRSGLDWRFIGAWDNDQGKGFDEVLPPERALDLDARYDGALVPITWRRPVYNPVGPELELSKQLTPDEWIVAYATSAFALEEEGTVELRVTSGSPFKLWLDGQLIFSARLVSRDLTRDRFVLPLELERGRHRLLVKLAHRTDDISFGLRATRDGRPLKLTPLEPDAAPTGGGRILGGTTPRALLSAEIERLAEALGPARALYHAVLEAERYGIAEFALELSDLFLSRAPGSIVATFTRMGATWNYGERGKASDLLTRLDERFGDELVLFRLQHARFLMQEGLLESARGTLDAVETNGVPEARADLGLRWSRYFEKEGWTEERCWALERALAARPGWRLVRSELRGCWDQLGFKDRLEALSEAQDSALADQIRAFQDALSDHEFEAAEDRLEILSRYSPLQRWTARALAEAYREKERFDAAEAALAPLLSLDPDDAEPWELIAHIRHQAKDREGAIAAFREVSLRSPDDDDVTQRLAYLSPEAREPWERDIPDETRIAEILGHRGEIEPPPGAHVQTHLDHEVSVLEPDGTITSVVTQVLTALDDTGRDNLVKMGLRSGGRLRVMSAYVLSPSGQRTQAASLRGREARFRNLEVGSTVVLQFRHDAPPVGYLSRHLARSWWFQGPADQRGLSEWVLWIPSTETLHERILDPTETVQRTESEEEGMTRVAWRAENVPPLVAEPGMPTFGEVAANLVASTVPDWDTYLEWEKALLVDAFRESSSMVSLAKEIVGDAQTPRDKALRIHRWLMERIRYEQDYETHIAGVKPHAASVVAERGYGDCKDKSVLFITLARQVGLEADFALLRTRPRGPLLREVPMQQFDHAIVYVPKQPGLEEGFFVDSTADALELDALRADDVGTVSLVLDPTDMSHRWRKIPYRAPEENGETHRMALELAADGSAKGKFELVARGQNGSHLRRTARNAQTLAQAMQSTLARTIPGAVAVGEAEPPGEDLRHPAELSIDLQVPQMGHWEDESLRMRLFHAFYVDRVFQLESRRYPLVMGTPQAFEFDLTLELPRKMRVKRLPPDVDIDGGCLRLTRRVRKTGRSVRAEHRLVVACERIPVEQYAAERAAVSRMSRALADELVLSGK